jgi:hypothetical protein
VVALLVRLKLTLLKNSLKRSVWRTVGLIIAMVYALGVVIMVLAALVGLRYTSLTLTADVTVVGYAALTLGWLLMSMLVFGVDETIDPAKFALLPVRARELLPGLLVAGLISAPGIATVPGGCRLGDHLGAYRSVDGGRADRDRPWSGDVLLALPGGDVGFRIFPRFPKIS